jgi:hypothetical protein
MVSFTMSERDLALRVAMAVADYYSLHRNLRSDFINGKPKKAIQHLVSVIKTAFCRPDQFSSSSYVDDNSSLLVSILPFLLFTMSSHRDVYIYEC